MIFPIVVYGDPVLRKRADDIPVGTDLKALIESMYETMQASRGVGLAASQIGQAIRLFVVDATTLDDEPLLKAFKKAFINPIILNEIGDDVAIEEGCLSIPNIREDVIRPSTIRIQYYDEQWQRREEQYSGFAARIIQHEYDHIEGVLFIDHLSPIKKKLMKGKLLAISKGDVDTEYRIAAPRKR